MNVFQSDMPWLVMANMFADITIVFAMALIVPLLLSMRKLFQWQVPQVTLTLFSVFILCATLTHVMDIVVLWYPWYWLLVASKLVASIASLITAIYLGLVLTGRRKLVYAIDHRLEKIL